MTDEDAISARYCGSSGRDTAEKLQLFYTARNDGQLVLYSFYSIPFPFGRRVFFRDPVRGYVVACTPMPVRS